MAIFIGSDRLARSKTSVNELIMSTSSGEKTVEQHHVAFRGTITAHPDSHATRQGHCTG